MSTVNLIAYLVINAFHVYIFLYSYQVFFGPAKIGRRLEIFSFLLFYLLNSGAFILIGNPFVNLATSVLPLLFLTLLYDGNGFTKLLIGLFVCLASMLFDAVSFALLQLFGLKITIGSQALGNLTSNLFLFLVVLIYKQTRQRKKQRALQFAHWLTIISLPVGSFVIAMFMYSEAVDTVVSLIAITILIVMNILVFYLYDQLDEYYFSSYEHHRLQQQNEGYLHELEIIKSSNDSIRMLRHDLKNYLFTAGKLLELKKYDELKDLIIGVSGAFTSTDTFVDTGNPELDSILNIKLDEANRLGATLDINITVPCKLSVTSVDMSIILGNLLDNAIEAMKESAVKTLLVHIYVDRGMLVLHVCNAFCGEREKVICGQNVFYKTKKQQPELHGLGLQSVKRAVEKYDGDMTISDTDGLFRVNIIMYLP